MSETERFNQCILMEMVYKSERCTLTTKMIQKQRTAQRKMGITSIVRKRIKKDKGLNKSVDAMRCKIGDGYATFRKEHTTDGQKD